MRPFHENWRRGFVRRWHMNPDMSGCDDYLHGHYGRVARIILHLNPNPSVALLRAALTHDDAEFLIGDVSPEAKELLAEMGVDIFALEKVANERLGVPETSLSDEEAIWLGFADKLDAYLWVHHHRPALLLTSEWRDARATLIKLGRRLMPSILHYRWLPQEPGSVEAIY